MGQDKVRTWNLDQMRLAVLRYGEEVAADDEDKDQDGDWGRGKLADICERYAALLARAEAAEAERDERQAEAASMAEDLRAADEENKRLREALEAVTEAAEQHLDGGPYGPMVMEAEDRKAARRACDAARAALRGEGGA